MFSISIQVILSNENNIVITEATAKDLNLLERRPFFSFYSNIGNVEQLEIYMYYAIWRLELFEIPFKYTLTLFHTNLRAFTVFNICLIICYIILCLPVFL